MKEMKKTNYIFVAVILIVGFASFYGGMIYGKSSDRSNFAGPNNTFQRQGLNQGQTGIGRNQGGFTSGEIISKDDKSLTVKLQNGGSKIIILSDSTSIGMAVAGSAKDLSVGQFITASGSSNSDGSITAQQIQIRPEMASSTPPLSPNQSPK